MLLVLPTGIFADHGDASKDGLTAENQWVKYSPCLFASALMVTSMDAMIPRIAERTAAREKRREDFCFMRCGMFATPLEYITMRAFVVFDIKYTV